MIFCLGWLVVGSLAQVDPVIDQRAALYAFFDALGMTILTWETVVKLFFPRECLEQLLTGTFA